MRQDDINRDLGSYLHDKKDKPFWKKSSVPKIKPHHEFDDEVVVKHEIERAETHTEEAKPIAQKAHHAESTLHEQAVHQPAKTSPIHNTPIHRDAQETAPHHELKSTAVHNVETPRESPIVHTPKDAKSTFHKDVEEVDIKDDVEDKIKIDEPREEPSVFKKLFKKIGLSKDEEEDEPRQIGHMQTGNNPEITMDDEELRELLHGLHNWIIQLPSDKLEKFKSSKEFEMYTKYLRKHNLIR